MYGCWQLLVLLFRSPACLQGFPLGYDLVSHSSQCLPLVPCPLPRLLVKDPEHGVTSLFGEMMIKSELV